MGKVLMKGNEAIGEAAIRAGAKSSLSRAIPVFFCRGRAKSRWGI